MRPPHPCLPYGGLVAPNGFGPQYAVDRTGNTFYVNSHGSVTPNAVTVIVNWHP